VGKKIGTRNRNLGKMARFRNTALDTCFERPEKYMEEVLRPIVEFRKYKAADSSAVKRILLLTESSN
jgi:hypothetical protein